MTCSPGPPSPRRSTKRRDRRAGRSSKSPNSPRLTRTRTPTSRCSSRPGAPSTSSTRAQNRPEPIPVAATPDLTTFVEPSASLRFGPDGCARDADSHSGQPTIRTPGTGPPPSDGCADRTARRRRMGTPRRPGARRRAWLVARTSDFRVLLAPADTSRRCSSIQETLGPDRRAANVAMDARNWSGV